MTFTCDVCGEKHAGETRDIRLGLPDAIFRIDEPEREERAVTTFSQIDSPPFERGTT